MTPMLVFHLGEILAANARVEGMKAENAFYFANGESAPCYRNDAFEAEASFIQMHAREVRNV